MKQKDVVNKDKGFYVNTFPSHFKLLHSGGEDSFLIKFGDAGMLSGTDGDIDTRLSSATKQAQVLERNFIEIGRWIDPVGVSRDYDVRDMINSVMPGNKQDPTLAKEAHRCYPPKNLLDEYREMSSWKDFGDIKDYVFNEIDKIIRKKSGVKKTRKAKMRKVQSRVIDKIIALMKEYGVPSNIIAELAPRFGKTITFIMLFKYLNEQFGHRIMTVPVYWLSSLTSFKSELEVYRDFENIVYVDKHSGDLDTVIPKLLSKGKLVIVGVSLHDKQDDFETRYKFIAEYKDLLLSVEDEADFGNHTPVQQEKLKYLYKNSQVTKIKMSGTNLARMSSGWRGETIHGSVSVPYSMIEQDESIKDVVKRKYFEMVMGQGLYSKMKDYDPSILPTWTKLGGKVNANREFWTALGKDIYGYEPIYGMNIDQAADDTIKYSMVFTSFPKPKRDMKQLANIWSEELDQHHVVVIDGETTSNADAEQLIKDTIHYMRIGHIKKDKLIVITNMMGSRSFSVGELQATLFFKDGGSIDTFIQQNQRDKTPHEGKEFGYTFDFAFDPNKLQNASLSIIYEAKQISKELGVSITDGVRYVFNSLNLARVDEFKAVMKNADSVLKDWEDDNKILSVCDEATDYQSILSDQALLDIIMNVNIDSIKSAKKKLLKKMPKGKTYGFDSRNMSDKDKNSLGKIIKDAIKNINRSATTVYDFANGGGTFKECLDIIETNNNISQSFEEMYGVSPTDIKQLIPYLQEHFLDICVNNSAKEF